MDGAANNAENNEKMTYSSDQGLHKAWFIGALAICALATYGLEDLLQHLLRPFPRGVHINFASFCVWWFLVCGQDWSGERLKYNATCRDKSPQWKDQAAVLFLRYRTLNNIIVYLLVTVNLLSFCMVAKYAIVVYMSDHGEPPSQLDTLRACRSEFRACYDACLSDYRACYGVCRADYLTCRGNVPTGPTASV